MIGNISMKKIPAIFICLFLCNFCIAQKNDYIWVMGVEYDTFPNGTILDFNHTPVRVSPNNADINFWWTDSDMCDSLGTLLFYTNGVNILNAGGNVMDGGYHIYNCDSTYYGNEGCPVAQSILSLPFPGFHQKYVNIMGQFSFWDVAGQNYQNGGLSSLFYNVIDMNELGGKGRLTETRNPILKDTLAITMAAVKHANGRDWWILAPKDFSNVYYRILLDTQGIRPVGEQILGIKNGSYDDSAFSPDGTTYVNMIKVTNTDFGLNIFRFDRCNGMLSEPTYFHYAPSGTENPNSYVWGIAISPNSRYLYVSTDLLIFQYDLQSRDIENSRTVVATYDGFRDFLNQPTSFGYPRLAPDGKIYVAPTNYEFYLHAIEAPDSAGIACRVVQRALSLPSPNRALPNYPNFRLGASKVVCQAAGSALQGTLSPNPTNGSSGLSLTLSSPVTGAGTLGIYDIVGRQIRSYPIAAGSESYMMDITGLAAGAYICTVLDGGKWVWAGKFVVVNP